MATAGHPTPVKITHKQNPYCIIWDKGWGKRWPRRTGLIRRVRNDGQAEDTFSHHESTRTEESFRITDAFYADPFPHPAEAGGAGVQTAPVGGSGPEAMDHDDAPVDPDVVMQVGSSTGQPSGAASPGADFTEPLPYDGRTDAWDYSCLIETDVLDAVVTKVPSAIIERDEYRYLLHTLRTLGTDITPAADNLRATKEDLESFIGLKTYARKSFLTIGHPGTGKTVFLLWLLLHLLENRQPVAFHSRSGYYYVFRPDGVFKCPAADPDGSNLLNGVWALVDSNAKLHAPADALDAYAKVVVYACSLRRDRFRRWQKETGARRIVTEVPHIFEAAAAGHECRPDGGLDISVEMYRRFGPSLRTIDEIQAAAHDERSNMIQAQVIDVRASAWALARNPHLLRAVDRLDVPSSIDSDLVVIRPLRHRPDGNFCPAICWVDVPTDYLRDVLSEAMLDLLLLLGPHPILRYDAGWAFETEMHRRFVSGGHPISLLDGTPAIRPAKKVVYGTVATLKELSPSKSTYWYPPTQDFPGIHAIFANFDDLFVLQAATDADEPVSPLEGLRKVRNALGPALTDRFYWYFVVVTRQWPGSESLAWLETELAGFVAGRADEPVAVRAAILR